MYMYVCYPPLHVLSMLDLCLNACATLLSPGVCSTRPLRDAEHTPNAPEAAVPRGPPVPTLRAQPVWAELPHLVRVHPRCGEERGGQHSLLAAHKGTHTRPGHLRWACTVEPLNGDFLK